MAYAPEPDLFIRTGGEQRISNFLLWQLAYTELYFTDMLWPDFDAAALDAAIASYRQRERRFGRTSEQVQAAAPAMRAPSRDSSMLKTRILTALVLIPLVLAALFLLPPRALGRRHPRRHRSWPRTSGPTRPASRGRAWRVRGRHFAGGRRPPLLPARGFARGWPDGDRAGRLRPAALFWVLVAPVWLRGAGRRPHRCSAMVCTGWVVLIGAWWRWSSCRRARPGSCWRRWRSSGLPTPPPISRAARSAGASWRRRSAPARRGKACTARLLAVATYALVLVAVRARMPALHAAPAGTCRRALARALRWRAHLGRRRPVRIAAEAPCGRQGQRQAAAGTRRRPRSHRCAARRDAAGRARACILRWSSR